MAASREGANRAVQSGRKDSDLIEWHVSTPTVSGRQSKPWPAIQATLDRIDGGDL